ncbi:MAG: hypothetical protein RLZZ385_523 [Pseudomonadota bacterium]|jgi:hypothetical protein
MKQVCAALLVAGMILPVPSAVAQTELDDATFRFVAASLQAVRREGQFPAALQLMDGQAVLLLDLLDQSYHRYKQGVEPDSPFCRFYMDPENGRMEIEERAAKAFLYLPPLASRLERYHQATLEFEDKVRRGLGDSVWTHIAAARLQAASFEYLPSWELAAEEKIHFADTVCGL